MALPLAGGEGCSEANLSAQSTRLGWDALPVLPAFWLTYGNVECKMVLDFLNQGISPPNFNETHIVPIPEVKEPKRVIDYRPISLCNVVYKIVSKVIANRLKKILPSIISET